MAHQSFGRSEAETIVSNQLDEVPEVDLLVDVENDEVVAIALLVAEKQVLDPDAWHVLPMLGGFLTGENGWVLVRRVRDPH